MKAAILERYDKNGCECKVRDIPVPEVSDGEVLVKIHTAGCLLARSVHLRSMPQ